MKFTIDTDVINRGIDRKENDEEYHFQEIIAKLRESPLRHINPMHNVNGNKWPRRLLIYDNAPNEYSIKTDLPKFRCWIEGDYYIMWRSQYDDHCGEGAVYLGKYHDVHWDHDSRWYRDQKVKKDMSDVKYWHQKKCLEILWLKHDYILKRLAVIYGGFDRN